MVHWRAGARAHRQARGMPAVASKRHQVVQFLRRSLAAHHLGRAQLRPHSVDLGEAQSWRTCNCASRLSVQRLVDEAWFQFEWRYCCWRFDLRAHRYSPETYWLENCHRWVAIPWRVFLLVLQRASRKHQLDHDGPYVCRRGELNHLCRGEHRVTELQEVKPQSFRRPPDRFRHRQWRVRSRHLTLCRLARTGNGDRNAVNHLPGSNASHLWTCRS